MAGFFDNVTGTQKLILVFGMFAAALAALVFFPTETGSLMTWVEDMVHHLIELVRGE